ncbi:hypothetical protein B4144_3770 [Bacillus atrophaeus]|nr:hypothetical protein B4144_3770 [Bacillus atrophaeus]
MRNLSKANYIVYHDVEKTGRLPKDGAPFFCFSDVTGKLVTYSQRLL